MHSVHTLYNTNPCTCSQAGCLKGMGYVEFSSVEEKNKAWELNGSEIAGGSLYVDGNVRPRTPGEQC